MEKKREKRTSRKGDRMGIMKPMTFRKEQMIQQQKVDIVTNIFRRLLHIQGGVTNMYMGNGKIFMKS